MSIRVFNKPAVVIGGGSSATLSSISISSNGTYSASAFGVDGFDVVDVDVQASGGADTGIIDYLIDRYEDVVIDSAFSKNGLTMKSQKYNYLTVNTLDLNKMNFASDCFFSVSCKSFVANNITAVNGTTFNMMSFNGSITLSKLLYCFPPRQGYTAFNLFSMTGVTDISLPELRMCHGSILGYGYSLKTAYLPKLALVCRGGVIFHSCSQLQYIDLPELVWCGSNYHFAGNPKISYINIPKGRVTLSYTTSAPTSLFSVNCPYGQGFGFGKAIFEEINMPYATSFMGVPSCPNLKSLFLPFLGSFSSLYNCSYCYSLSVVMAGGLSSIAANAFFNCSSLESLYLLNCKMVNLANVNAFNGTPMSNETLLGHYGSIYVPSSWVASFKTATNWLAYSDRITAIPSEIESKFIFAWEFSSKSTITAIPSEKLDAEYVLPYAFANCSNLEGSIYLSKCKAIGTYAFSSCRKITDIDLSQCEIIMSSAFYNCLSAISFNFPNVKYIEDNNLVFYGTRISYLSFPELLFLGSYNNFTNQTLNSCSYIYMPKLVTAESTFDARSTLTSVNFNNFVGFHGSYTRPLLRSEAKVSGTLSLPNLVGNAYLSGTSVESIYAPLLVDFSFTEMRSLNSLYAPNLLAVGWAGFRATKFSTFNTRQLMSFGGSIFENASIKDFFNLKIEVLNGRDFYNCSNLSKAFFGNLRRISGIDFQACFNLLSVYLQTPFLVSLNSSGAFTMTPIQSSSWVTPNRYGSIFVPASLLSNYQNDSVWSWYSQRIVGLTDQEFQDVIDHWDD